MNDVSPVLSVKKTGGFAGVSFNFEQRIAELKDNDRTQLNLLITACGLRTAAVNKKSKNARDVFNYSFMLQEGNATYNASFDDTTLTPAYRKLFQYVQELSRHG
jgi:ribosomal 50S subunit-associated protein YjgA (DUF615 family)